jgi:preprotein translocase subunit SecE
MAKQGVNSPSNRRAAAPGRPAAPAKPPVAAAVPAEPKVKRPPFNPVKFWREVLQEARKITWTSWRETWITSVLVFIMVAITGVFFLAVDQALGFGMQYLLKLAQS